MKILKTITFLLTVACLTNGCKKSATTAASTSGLVTTPEALAVNNTVSQGIYKGVVVGSTGTIRFDIANNGATITAVMIIDGITVNLTSPTAPVTGKPYSAVFTGSLSGSAVTFTFSVDASGHNPAITAISIPGHPAATFLINKETSTSLIEAFLGTYSTTKGVTGTFDMVISVTDGTWSVIERPDGSTLILTDAGTVVNHVLYEQTTNRIIGTISGTDLDQLNGSFSATTNSTEVTTIKGTRSL
jgi:hypothetical protein